MEGAFRKFLIISGCGVRRMADTSSHTILRTLHISRNRISLKREKNSGHPRICWITSDCHIHSLKSKAVPSLNRSNMPVASA